MLCFTKGELKETLGLRRDPVAKTLHSQCGGVQVRFLVRELDGTCHKHNEDHRSPTKTQGSQININIFKRKQRGPRW